MYTNQEHARGYLLGYFAGDGCYIDCNQSKPGRWEKPTVGLYGHGDDRLRVEEALVELGLPYSEHKVSNPGNWAFRLSNPTVLRLFVGCDTLLCKGDMRKIPEEVFESYHLRKGFVEGLWDADGYISRTSIDLKITSEELVAGVKQILEDLGMSPKRPLPYIPKEGSTSVKKQHRVYLNKKDFGRFRSLFTLQDKKQSIMLLQNI